MFAYNSNDEPDYRLFQVRLTEKQRQNGLHLKAARIRAEATGLQKEMVVINAGDPLGARLSASMGWDWQMTSLIDVYGNEIKE